MSEIKHASLEDELLYLIGRATSYLTCAALYERCEMADEIAEVATALHDLQADGKIVRVDGPGRARYKLADGVPAPAPAGKVGRPAATTNEPKTIETAGGMPQIDIPKLGDLPPVAPAPAAARLADAIVAHSREQLAPGLEGGPQWWIDQDGCLEVANRGDVILVEFTREQALLMAEMIIGTNELLERL